MVSVHLQCSGNACKQYAEDLGFEIRLHFFLNLDQHRYELVCTGMYQYVPVCTSMYWYVLSDWYVLVCASMYWYILVAYSMYQYEPVHTLTC